MATNDEMIDDQTLMDSMPASREFVLPEERKMYRGFQMPAGMSTEQEMAYKAAIDEREDFGSKAARQLPRIADDVRESIRGVGRSAKEVGKEMFREAAPLPGMAKAAGQFATDAALTIPRAKVAMYADPEGSEEFARSVVAGDREARKQLATGASESMVEPAATMGDVALTKYAVEEGRLGEAAITGAAVLLPYVSAAALRAIMKGGSKAADDAAKQLSDLESGLKDGTISEDQAKEIGESIEQVFSATTDLTSMGTFPGYTARSADFMKVKDRMDLPEEMDRIDYDEEMSILQEDQFGPSDLDPEDLAMERRQDVREGITMDMRGTPRVEPPSRDFTPNQMAELEAETRRLGLSTVDELLDLRGEPLELDTDIQYFSRPLKTTPPNQGPMTNEDYIQIERLLREKPGNETSELLLEMKSRFDSKTGRINGRSITNPKTREKLRMLRDQMAFEGREDFQRPDYFYTFKDRIDAEMQRNQDVREAITTDMTDLPKLKDRMDLPKEDYYMSRAIEDFNEFSSEYLGPTKLYRLRQYNPDGFVYVESSSPEAAQQLLEGELFEGYVHVGGVIEKFQDLRRKGRYNEGLGEFISESLSEASPEESAKYFDMKANMAPIGRPG